MTKKVLGNGVGWGWRGEWWRELRKAGIAGIVGKKEPRGEKKKRKTIREKCVVLLRFNSAVFWGVDRKCRGEVWQQVYTYMWNTRKAYCYGILYIYILKVYTTRKRDKKNNNCAQREKGEGLTPPLLYTRYWTLLLQCT